MAATAHTHCCCGTPPDTLYPCCVGVIPDAYCYSLTVTDCANAGGFVIETCPNGEYGPCQSSQLGKCGCPALTPTPPTFLLYNSHEFFLRDYCPLPVNGQPYPECQRLTNREMQIARTDYINLAKIVFVSDYGSTACGGALPSPYFQILNHCTGGIIEDRGTIECRWAISGRYQPASSPPCRMWAQPTQNAVPNTHFSCYGIIDTFYTGAFWEPRHDTLPPEGDCGCVSDQRWQNLAADGGASFIFPRCLGAPCHPSHAGSLCVQEGPTSDVRLMMVW